MKKRLLAMLLAAAMIISIFAACGNGESSTPAQSANSSSATESETTPKETSAGPDDTSEHVDATVYVNYDWWGVMEWGGDAASAYMRDKFNIDLNWTKPDADAAARLNIMLSGNDLPDVIMMDRGPDLNKVARTGKLVDLETLMYPGDGYSENIPEATRDFLRIDGVLYSIPNYARKAATGGNYQWMVNSRVYEEVGSPDLSTFEGLHQYALAVRDAHLTAYSGTEVIPFIPGSSSNGQYIYQPIYRAMGMPNLVEGYFTQEDETLQYCLDSENFVEALRIANQWYKEGLFTVDAFTDGSDQFREKLTGGRAGLVWYDFSQDDGDNFRRILIQQTSGAETYEVIGSEYFHEEWPMFPAMDGVDVTYGDEGQTVGWNVSVITTSAKNPQRLFDLYSWVMTEEGSINAMYGPEGGLWEGKDENGIPLLVKPEDQITAEEKDAAGSWFWKMAIQSDNVDRIKFAINDQFPPEQRNWVVSIQAHTTSYNEENPRIGQKFITDQGTGLSDTVDPQDQDGINRALINDQTTAQLPKIIMAEDDASFDALVTELRDYVHANGVDEILEKYQAKFDENVATQGFNAYDPAYDVYHLNH